MHMSHGMHSQVPLCCVLLHDREPMPCGRPLQTSVSRATAFNSSLSQRVAARDALSQLTSAPDVSPVRPPDAICRAAYGDAAAPASTAAEERNLSSPAQPASASNPQDGDSREAVGTGAAAAVLAGGELLPAAARQVGLGPEEVPAFAVELTTSTLLATITFVWDPPRSMARQHYRNLHTTALDVLDIKACG